MIWVHTVPIVVPVVVAAGALGFVVAAGRLQGRAVAAAEERRVRGKAAEPRPDRPGWWFAVGVRVLIAAAVFHLAMLAGLTGVPVVWLVPGALVVAVGVAGLVLVLGNDPVVRSARTALRWLVPASAVTFVVAALVVW